MGLIMNELMEQKYFNKSVNDKYDALYQKYMIVQRLNAVLLWNADDIVTWITKLNDGYFIKYKYHLLYNMTEENVNGSMLNKLKVTDLHRFGIVDINDQFLLLSYINKLMNNS